jgi:SAM-dependent methyltransferase
MNDQFRSEEDDAPTSEPSTLITNSPVAEAALAADRALKGDAVAAIAPAHAERSTGFTPEPGTAKKARTRMTLRIPDDEVARPSQPPSLAPTSHVAPITSGGTSGAASPVPSPVASPGALPAVSPPPSVVVSGGPASPSVASAPPAASPAANGPASTSAAARPPITAQRIINLSVDTPTKEIPVTSAAARPSASPPLPAVTAPPPHAPAQAAAPKARSEAPKEPDEDSWTPYQSDVADHEPPPDSSQSVEISIETGAFDQEPEGESRAAVLPEPAREVPSVALTPPAVATGTAAPVHAPPVAQPARAARRPKSSDDFTDMVVEEEEDLAKSSQSTPAALPPPRARHDATLDADEVSIESSPPSRPPLSSEPSDLAEVSPEDVVSVEAVAGKARVSQSAPPPPMRARASSVPNFSVQPVPKLSRPSTNPGFSTATIKTTVAPEHATAPPKPRPLVIVPTASPLAPPPMTDAASARKRARPGWEDLFNDDFIRTMAKITDAQIAKEVDFIEESLGLDKGAMVLDLACGTGRHAIELTRRGYQVVGFDLSLAMLAKAADEAQDRSQKLNFVQGDMREMTFDGTFDGVYCWNTSFGFFEEEKNAAVIANVRRALKPGGQVLLDVVNRDFIAEQCPSLVWFEGDGCVCMDDMTIDWITSRMKVKRTMMMDDGRSREIEYSIRLYALHELGKLLHDNGFRVAQVSGRVATPGVFFGANSPRTLILAEKK